jgi:hypothetical protein
MLTLSYFHLKVLFVAAIATFPLTPLQALVPSMGHYPGGFLSWQGAYVQGTRIGREKSTFGELSANGSVTFRDMIMALSFPSNSQPTLAKPPHPILWRHRV